MPDQPVMPLMNAAPDAPTSHVVPQCAAVPPSPQPAVLDAWPTAGVRPWPGRGDHYGVAPTACRFCGSNPDTAATGNAGVGGPRPATVRRRPRRRGSGAGCQWRG